MSLYKWILSELSPFWSFFLLSLPSPPKLQQLYGNQQKPEPIIFRNVFQTEQVLHPIFTPANFHTDTRDH